MSSKIEMDACRLNILLSFGYGLNMLDQSKVELLIYYILKMQFFDLCECTKSIRERLGFGAICIGCTQRICQGTFVEGTFFFF